MQFVFTRSCMIGWMCHYTNVSFGCICFYTNLFLWLEYAIIPWLVGWNSPCVAKSIAHVLQSHFSSTVKCHWFKLQVCYLFVYNQQMCSIIEGQLPVYSTHFFSRCHWIVSLVSLSTWFWNLDANTNKQTLNIVTFIWLHLMCVFCVQTFCY